MPRTKRAVAKMSAEPKPKTYTLTEDQFNSLKQVSGLLGDARRTIDNVESSESFQAASFQAGKAYAMVDKAEDAVDAIINAFEEELDWSDEDDDDDN